MAPRNKNKSASTSTVKRNIMIKILSGGVRLDGQFHAPSDKIIMVSSDELKTLEGSPVCKIKKVSKKEFEAVTVIGATGEEDDKETGVSDGDGDDFDFDGDGLYVDAPGKIG